MTDDAGATARGRLMVRFYRTASGNEVVADEIRALGTEVRAEVLRTIRRRARHEHFDREDEMIRDRISALRITHQGAEYRVLYALVGTHSEVLLAVRALNKQARRLPLPDLRLAQRRLADWEGRGRGTSNPYR